MHGMVDLFHASNCGEKSLRYGGVSLERTSDQIRSDTEDWRLWATASGKLTGSEFQDWVEMKNSIWSSVAK